MNPSHSRPNRIFSIAPAAHGLYALTTNGDIYYGYFIDKGPFIKTGWQWRKVPKVPQAIYEYSIQPEPSQAELEGMARDAFQRMQPKKPRWKFWGK